MSKQNIRRASLEEIKAMKARGELFVSNEEKPGENLGPEFWKKAETVNYRPPTSVHLKLDASVFDYFKAQGKGHLTRMQDVLKDYVLAHTNQK